MAQILTPASLDDLMKEKPIPKRNGPSEFNKTQKNYSSSYPSFPPPPTSPPSPPNNRVSGVLKSLQEMDDDDATQYLGDFNPPPAPHSSGVQRTVEKDTNNNQSSGTTAISSIPSRSSTGGSQEPAHMYSSGGSSYELNNLKYTYKDPMQVNEYYSNMVPNYKPGLLPNMFSKSSGTNLGKQEGMANVYEPDDSMLIQKLNYMIHLLEDKRDIKTNNTIEEIIMYCFLGIFIIFIVDSFSRVGKYIR